MHAAPRAKASFSMHTRRLPSPAELMAALPSTSAQISRVAGWRHELTDALTGCDRRMTVIVGPCSIEDCDAAREYASRLARLRRIVGEQIHLVMRVYFEKPRTTIGWKGFLMDPTLDGSAHIEEGLTKARRLLLDIINCGVPCATEFLHPGIAVYLQDLVAWAAIGARSSESQIHREMVSGMSLPVGFKNATNGSILGAVNAMRAAAHPQPALTIDSTGRLAISTTSGNRFGHLILRGGFAGTNYDRASVIAAAAAIADHGLERGLMVDCSHGNCTGDYRLQRTVFFEVLEHILDGVPGVLGAMLESHLLPGKQTLQQPLTFGQSVTDPCLGWEETEEMILCAADRLAGHNRSNGAFAP